MGKEFKNVPKNSEEIKLSIVGHPNVGKSSIFNLLTESNRSIVSNIPGTTRDSIDYTVKYDDKNIKFIDTAGLRRRGKIERGIEKYSSIRTIKSVENADVCVLVLSAEEMITAQDLHISGFIKDLMRPCILININKRGYKMKALRKSLSGKAAIVGVAESDKIGKVPEISPRKIKLFES